MYFLELYVWIWGDWITLFWMYIEYTALHRLFFFFIFSLTLYLRWLCFFFIFNVSTAYFRVYRLRLTYIIIAWSKWCYMLTICAMMKHSLHWNMETENKSIEMLSTMPFRARCLESVLIESHIFSWMDMKLNTSFLISYFPACFPLISVYVSIAVFVLYTKNSHWSNIESQQYVVTEIRARYILDRAIFE